MPANGWTTVRIGLAVAFLAACPAPGTAQTGPSSPADESVSIAPPPSKWAARPLQIAVGLSFATVQALEVVTTLQTLQAPGSSQTNPTLAGLQEHPVFFAIKSASTIASIVSMRRFAKQHPKAAVFITAGLDVSYAFLVRSNLRQVSGR